MMLGAFAMFLLSLMLISVPQKNNQDDQKNIDFIVRIEWQSHSSDDIDLWAKDPQGHIVGFRNKQTDDMYLERDDLGTDPDRMKPGHVNEEILTIRSAHPGTYTFNIHWYEKRVNNELPIVKWSISRMRPTMKTEKTGTVTMHQEGEEDTLIRITLDENNNIVDSDNIQDAFVVRKIMGAQ